MNEEFHTYIQKAGDEISLSQAERTKMRSVLSAYMEMKPIRTGAPTASAWGIQWFVARHQYATALILVLFVGSGGISYAAEGALPGDALYPVKVHINEPVAGALALSSSAKAEWAMSVAGERIKEASALASEGRLSTTTQTELQSSFEAHSAVAIQNINAEANTSPDTGGQSATHFEVRLSEYERTLSTIDGPEIASSTLVSAIRDVREHVAEIRVHTALGIMNAARAAKQSTSSSVTGERQDGRNNSFRTQEDKGGQSATSTPAATTTEKVDIEIHTDSKSQSGKDEDAEVQTVIQTVSQPVSIPAPSSFFH